MPYIAPLAEPTISTTRSVDSIPPTSSPLQTRDAVLPAKQNPCDSTEDTVFPSIPAEAVVLESCSTLTRNDHVLVQGKSDVAAEEISKILTDAQCNEDKRLHKENIAPSADNDELPYPEGGFRAWLVVIGSCFGCAVTLGMMNTVGTLYSYLKEHQLKDYNEGTIGWIFSVFIFLGFFGGLQVGPIFDARGPKALILAGSICMGTSLLLLGSCTDYWHFMLCFGLLGGIGASLIFTPALSGVGHFFLEKRGTATGIAAAGGSLGGIIFPLALERLFPMVGFAWATRIIGFVVIICCAMALLLVRSRLPPKPDQKMTPNLRMFCNSSYFLLTLGIFFMEWALFVPITYLTSFALLTGTMTQRFSYQLIAIMNAGSCIGRWAPGYVADRLGRFNSMIAALALCAAITLALWLPASILIPSTTSDAAVIKTLSIAYALIFGLASGANISLTPVCVGQLCDITEYGRYYATCYTVVSFGTLTGIPIAGTLVQLTGGHYWGVVAWTASCYIISLSCFIWSRACCVGWRLGVEF